MADATSGVLRMLDANLNRAAEGLRVAEDVLRFSKNQRKLSGEARALRHAVGKAMRDVATRNRLVAARDSVGDVGATRWQAAKPRKHANDLLTANMRRAQESLRVLEEGARVVAPPRCARALQALRYRLYDLDRRIASACRVR